MSHFAPRENLREGLGSCLYSVAIQYFCLWVREELLQHRVAETGSYATHGTRDSKLSPARAKGNGSVFAGVIRVMDNIMTALRISHCQNRQGELTIWPSIHCPPDCVARDTSNTTAEYSHPSRWHVCRIGEPQRVRPVRLESVTATFITIGLPRPRPIAPSVGPNCRDRSDSVRLARSSGFGSRSDIALRVLASLTADPRTRAGGRVPSWVKSKQSSPVEARFRTLQPEPM